MAEEVIETPGKQGGANARLILAGVALVALALFVFQNTDDAEVRFLWMKGSIPLFLLLLVTVVLTLIIGFVAAWWIRRHD